MSDYNSDVWPPASYQNDYNRYSVLSAWYSGDPDRLSSVYGGTISSGDVSPASRNFFTDSRLDAGVKNKYVGSIQRWFWGEKVTSGEYRAKLHVPIFSDLTAYSSELLFSEPPKFVFNDKNTQDYFERMIESTNFLSMLIEAADVCAALGDVYLVATWDNEVSDYPFIRAVHADEAIPEFKWGQLSAVTFHHRVGEDDNNQIYRHLERHESGRITHKLYLGDIDTLGNEIPLSTLDITKNLEKVVLSAPGKFTAVHIPNIRPNRDKRSSCLGSSDFSIGTLTLMDGLDETWSSWLRDVYLGKSRLFVPHSLLNNKGAGSGASFDREQHMFTILPGMVSPDQPLSSQITENQFDIRHVSFERTVSSLLSQIVKSSGYSPSSYTEDGKTVMTATEIHSRDRKSYVTRSKKSRYWIPALAKIVSVTLELANIHFGAGVDSSPPEVELVDSVQELPLTLAQTAATLYGCETASLEERLRIVHPNWDNEHIDREIVAIRDEYSKEEKEEEPQEESDVEQDEEMSENEDTNEEDEVEE